MANLNRVSLLEYLYERHYDIDARVKVYLDKIDRVEMSTYKPMDFKIPHFSNKTEQRKWEIEQIRRTRFGHDGICGMMYLYTYFWKMKSKGGGLISPEFRRCNVEFFNLIESCLYGEHPDGLYGDNRGWGVIMIGRRRWGKSYSLANAMYATAIHNPYSEIGITSKTEDDMRKFISDVLKTGYDNLPQFLRATTQAGNSQSRMEFSKKIKDKHGNVKKVGLNSVIFGRSPEPTSFEGSGLRLLVYEEPGKWAPGQLRQNWSYAEPALAADDGIRRQGVPLFAGTAGDIDDNGDDLKDFWYNAEAYKLKNYFAAGWSGFMIQDECGNENVIEGLKYILDEREKKKKQGMKRYYDFVVQYPLEPEDCFLQVGESPFDIEMLNNRMKFLDKNPPVIQRGYFKRGREGKVEFMVSDDGAWQIFERYEKGRTYAAGCDPTDGAAAANEGSDLSFFVAKGISLDDNFRGQVAQYTAKPKDMNEAYEQCLLACEYYECTVLIENNRKRMIAYFEDRGFSHLMANRPKKVGKHDRMRTIEKGAYMDEGFRAQMIGAIDDDIRENVETYVFYDLLSHLCHYNPENRKKKYDRVDAWGLTLINLRTIEKRGLLKKSDEVDFSVLDFKNINGKIQRP